MSQLIGGRKRQNTEMEAAWGTLDRTLPSSSRKRERARCPCLPYSAYQREMSDPAANFSSSPSGPVVCLGFGQLPL